MFMNQSEKPQETITVHMGGNNTGQLAIGTGNIQIGSGTPMPGYSATLPPPENLATQQQILDNLHHSFDESELRDLYFRMGVKYEDLPGQSKADKARELVLYMVRAERLSVLSSIGAELRPALTWPAI
jgi:hypothetical protein